MISLINQIDFGRFSGIHRILGVDLTPLGAHVVLLRRRGNWFNKYNSHFSVDKTFSVDFPERTPPLEKAHKLREKLLAERIKTKYAVSAIRSSSFKCVNATVASSTENISEWIKEHHERLLKLPVPLDTLKYDYEILDADEEETRLEITFVRKSDVDEVVQLFNDVGLGLLALGVGARDFVSGYLVCYPDALKQKSDKILFHLGRDFICAASYVGPKRQAIRYYQVRSKEALLDQMSKYANSVSNEHNIYVTGDFIEPVQSTSYNVLQPFKVATSFSLATGLAIKGFLPELSPTNYLPTDILYRTEINLLKRLTLRLGVVLGGSLIILLIVSSLAIQVFTSKLDKLDEQAILMGDQYKDVSILEDQVHQLESSLHSPSREIQRSSYSQIIHQLSSVTPDSVWLYKLYIAQGAPTHRDVSLYGYAVSNDAITMYLKKLQTIASDVQLIRSGSPLQVESALPHRHDNGGSYRTFEIEAFMLDE